MPRGLLDTLTGPPDHAAPDAADPAAHAVDTSVVDRRAVAAVLAAERVLGRAAESMPHNNPGYDVRSRDPGTGGRIDIEVKGRVAGAAEFFVSRTQVFHAKNVGDAYRLALVSVDPARVPEHDEVRYLANPFLGADFGAFESTASPATGPITGPAPASPGDIWSVRNFAAQVAEPRTSWLYRYRGAMMGVCTTGSPSTTGSWVVCPASPAPGSPWRR